MVDPVILTVKAILGVFVLAQVFAHVWFFPRYGKKYFCDDRTLTSLMTVLCTMGGFATLGILYFLVFVW